ncbi:MAG: 16S rRNA (adenine(1518)-N(6)/adenine(1519)-N(6))-dimethyltransferase RsmA [Rhodospirillales bacterium]
MTDDLPPLREIIARYGLGARKSLGQHFLLDLNLTRRIVRDAGNLAGETVVEIGPGPGGLTRALLESDAVSVIAVERDSRCIEALAGLLDRYGDRFRLIEGDALAFPLSNLADHPVHIVANLPYNVATPLMIGWLKERDWLKSMTVMVQKEVADRFLAKPGEKAYGRLAVLAGWLCRVERVMNVPAAAFTPPPKVDSSVIRLTPLPALDEPSGPAAFGAMEKVTAAAFGQRRKMLRQSLKSLGLDLAELAIEPTARAENLDVAAYIRLARAFAAKG